MCLVTDQKEPIILTEDLNVVKVFKINKSFLISAYWEFIYVENHLYQTSIERSNSKNYFDGIDGHILYRAYGDNWRDNKNLIFFGNGFHSVSNVERVENIVEIAPKRYGAYNATIPAGSEVYYGVDKDLIISNQIIIKDKYEK